MGAKMTLFAQLLNLKKKEEEKQEEKINGLTV